MVFSLPSEPFPNQSIPHVKNMCTPTQLWVLLQSVKVIITIPALCVATHLSSSSVELCRVSSVNTFYASPTGSPASEVAWGPFEVEHSQHHIMLSFVLFSPKPFEFFHGILLSFNKILTLSTYFMVHGKVTQSCSWYFIVLLYSFNTFGSFS